VKVAIWSQLKDRIPTYALVADVDLVVIRFGDRLSVLFGRLQTKSLKLAVFQVGNPDAPFVVPIEQKD